MLPLWSFTVKYIAFICSQELKWSSSCGGGLTYTGSVGDPTFLVVTRQTFLLLAGDVVSEEGGVTLLCQFVLADNLVLPDCPGNLARSENTISGDNIGPWLQLNRGSHCHNNDMKGVVDLKGGV